MFYQIVWGWILAGIILFPLLLKIKAPYGRHASKKWGPQIDNRLGWIIMEFPSLFVFAFLFLSGDAEKGIIKWILFSLWVLHYTNRVFIYPLRTRTSGKKIPLIIVVFAIVFNLVNGSINGYWLGSIASPFGQSWLWDPRFITGMVIFITGFVINQDSDRRLLSLRKNGEPGKYYIPKGGMFRYVSCPNFFGEIVEWTGFAIAAWSLPAFSFALWTFLNLTPRAMDHHRWYKEHFDDYPASRKAVIPFIL